MVVLNLPFKSTVLNKIQIYNRKFPEAPFTYGHSGKLYSFIFIKYLFVSVN